MFRLVIYQMMKQSRVKKYEMALEYFEFNIKGAWVGENTPFFTVIR